VIKKRNAAHYAANSEKIRQQKKDAYYERRTVGAKQPKTPRRGRRFKYSAPEEFREADRQKRNAIVKHTPTKLAPQRASTTRDARPSEQLPKGELPGLSVIRSGLLLKKSGKPRSKRNGSGG
jgi:hypothetical protein